MQHSDCVLHLFRCHSLAESSRLLGAAGAQRQSSYQYTPVFSTMSAAAALRAALPPPNCGAGSPASTAALSPPDCCRPTASVQMLWVLCAVLQQESHGCAQKARIGALQQE